MSQCVVIEKEFLLLLWINSDSKDFNFEGWCKVDINKPSRYINLGTEYSWYTGDFFEVWNKGYPPKSWKIECQVKHLKLPLFNVVQLTQFHVQWKLKLSFCYDFVELNKSGNFKCFTWHSIFHDFGGYPPFQTSK